MYVSAIRDYADKSFLATSRAKEETALQKAAGIAGIVFMLVMVFGSMIVSSVQ